MKDNELYFLSATEAGRLLQARKLSPVELLDAFLKRIESVDGKLKSYLLLTADTAREAARQAERDIMAGRWKGPLHGVPYAVKDNYYTRGVRTCVGSRLLMDNIPDYDATAIVKMREAGAILLGKLNTWEYGTGNGGVYFDLPFEPACNPWDLDRFTGGSSTGSGASVAGGTAMAALGSDTGGSVRLPSAACGLQGMKPTYGRVSRHGILPNCYTLDAAGPLTWTVEDSALLLRAISGYDPADPGSAKVEVPDFLQDLESGVRGMAIGVIRDLGDANDLLDGSNRAAMEAMIEVLAREGARIVELSLPAPLAEYRKVTSVINWTESLSIHEQDFMTRNELMGQALREKMMSGFMTRAVDYLAAQRRRRELASTMNELVCSVDALVLPCALHVAPPFADFDRVKAFTADTVCPPFNVSGHPGMSVCTGFDKDGVPTNAQIVGRWFDEANVYRVARAYERATAWRDIRPKL
jgi:aspartyl-tRNA(Asn)/glutamyl-tRNA(Gln) amidotransferase subunit A